jgi:hypothetical protein
MGGAKSCDSDALTGDCLLEPGFDRVIRYVGEMIGKAQPRKAGDFLTYPLAYSSWSCY